MVLSRLKSWQTCMQRTGNVTFPMSEQGFSLRSSSSTFWLFCRSIGRGRLCLSIKGCNKSTRGKKKSSSTLFFLIIRTTPNTETRHQIWSFYETRQEKQKTLRLLHVRWTVWMTYVQNTFPNKSTSYGMKEMRKETAIRKRKPQRCYGVAYNDLNFCLF